MENNSKDNLNEVPDNTAVRTALWRALHVQIDGQPAILEDEVGLALVAPDPGWQDRPDMDPEFTKRLRASIVARARYIEDLILEQYREGITQYVLMGAGLDSFAERRTDIASKLQIFEIDQPDTLAWKKRRLMELGFLLPEGLHFVAVDFETTSWWEQLLLAGFNPTRPAFVSCTGVSLYLTKAAIMDTLRQFATLATGSTLAMTFYLPLALMDDQDKPLQLIAEKGAREAGTPFVSYFSMDELLALAKDAGFKKAKTISTKDMDRRYFADRTDGLLPASGEVFLVATV